MAIIKFKVSRDRCYTVVNNTFINDNRLDARYKLTDADGWKDMTDVQLINLIGKKRGCLIPGGIVDTERVSNLLIDEFRGVKIGRISLEVPPEV